MSDVNLYEDTHGDGCGCPADQTQGIDGTPGWAYDEDGYCACCGNGRWKHHMPECELRDALDARRLVEVAETSQEWRVCEVHGQTATKVAESCSWAILADALHTNAGTPPRYAAECRVVSRQAGGPPTTTTRFG